MGVPPDPAVRLPPARRLLVPLLLGLALAGLTLAAYAPVLGGGYEFLNIDDDEYVTDNPHVRGGLTGPGLGWALTTFHANNWHPLTWVSLQLDAELYGLDPRGYHATNLLLHAANALLLFAALRRLTGATGRSFCVAALFAVHPLHVESVAWVAERKDVLSTLFWMLTLLAYARYAERPGPVRYLPVVLALALGLAAKPMLVTLPCVLLLLDYWPLRRLCRWPEGPSPWGGPAGPAGRLVAEKLPLFALAAACCVLTFLAQVNTRHSLNLPPGVRLANALVSYATYPLQMVWPRDLAAFYPHPRASLGPAAVAGAAVLLAAGTALAWWLRRRRPYVAVGWLWYLGTLVPVIGLVQVGHQAHADRYTYVPLVGLFLLLVWGAGDAVERLRVPRLAAGLGAAAVLAACVGLTRGQLSYWTDSLVLWRHAYAVTPDNPFPHFGQALALEARGQYAEAEEQYRLAVTMRPHPPQFRTAYGVFLQKRRRPREARRQFEAALRGNPDDPVAHWHLGVLCDAAGRPEEARRHYAAVLRAQPGNADAHYNLGMYFQRRRRWDEARRHFAAAARSRPGDAEAHAHLGVVLMMQSRLARAREELARAAELDPRLADVQVNLGAVCWKEGRRAEARAHFLRALELDPRHAEAHCNLGWAYLEEGRVEQARREFRRALAINPRYAPAHHNLGEACRRQGREEEARRHFAEAERLGAQADPPPAPGDGS
jgi:tetratricopeptide (TPR) repeat protein